MQNETKRLYMLVILIAALLLASVTGILLYLQHVRNSDAGSAGLLPKDEDKIVLEGETKTSRKVYLTKDLMQSFEPAVLSFIEKNDLSGLDNYLKDVSEYYEPDERNEYINLDYSTYAEELRGDVALIRSNAVLSRSFYNWEGVLYSYLHLPVSRKIDMPVSNDSKILPPGFAVKDLKELEFSPENYLAKLHEIEGVSGKYSEFRQFTCTIDGTPAVITLVQDAKDFTWTIYSMEGDFPVTAGELKKLKEEADINFVSFDYDAFFQKVD